MDRADGSDFATYVDARWPDLVGGLEDEGVPADDARLAVAEALVASRRGWARRVRDENVDVALWAEVRERAGLPPIPGSAAPHGVRRFDPRDAPEVWLARAEEARGTRRRRGMRRGLVWLLTAAVLAAAWLWWASLPEQPSVREEANDLPVIWYAGGELHLPDVVVGLPAVDEFVASGSGAVVRLRSGEVVRIDADGALSELDESPEALDERPEPPSFVARNQDDVLLESAPIPGGGWAHLLDSSRADDASDARRQTDTARRAIVVCTEDLACGPLRTIYVDPSIRLR